MWRLTLAFFHLSPFHSLLLKFIYEHKIHEHNLSRGANRNFPHFLCYCSQHRETHLQLEANLLDWESKYWFPPQDGANGIEELETRANVLHLKQSASWIIEEIWLQNLWKCWRIERKDNRICRNMPANDRSKRATNLKNPIHTYCVVQKEKLSFLKGCTIPLHKAS